MVLELFFNCVTVQPKNTEVVTGYNFLTRLTCDQAIYFKGEGKI